VSLTGNTFTQRNRRLSHFMARSLANLDKNVGFVQSSCSGRVIVAEDLACVALPQQ